MADLVELRDLFHIEYGNQFDRNKLMEDRHGVNFVSRSSSNLGVDAKVRLIEGAPPYEAGLITATLGGTYLLSTFVQPETFYTGQNIKVLRPIAPMSFNEKIYYCVAIARNRFRYTSHGREANKTFDRILVPPYSAVPAWVSENSSYDDMLGKVESLASAPPGHSPLKLAGIGSQRAKISDLFDVIYGHNLELNALDRLAPEINFVSRTSENNGVSAKVKLIPGLKPTEAGVLTVAGGGSVLETFVQPEPFYSGRDLYFLRPKVPMTLEQKLFFCMCIRSNRYRYNFGRQANKTLRDIEIPDVTAIPEWIGQAYGEILGSWPDVPQAKALI
jgi:hypothetical protein